MRDFKLYEIVLVTHDNYKHYGEILSRRTPSDTFMVRMVPGHPGTLREMSADKLERTTQKIRYIHYATIKGPGQFPTDMLRYDFAAPVNFDLETKKIDPTFGSDQMIVATASERQWDAWTPARWHSFLWKIDELKTERFTQE